MLMGVRNLSEPMTKNRNTPTRINQMRLSITVGTYLRQCIVLPPRHRPRWPPGACAGVNSSLPLTNSREIRPRWKTTIRSQVSMSSVSSSETTATATPSLGELVDDAQDLHLGLHVHALRGLVEEQDPRLGGGQLGDHHLLLVAAAEVLDVRLHGRGLDAEACR